MSNAIRNMKSNWHEYDEGYTVGTVGGDGGAIVRDEEHKSGARITLEEEGSNAPFVVTCGIYGWMFHTRYFADEAEAGEEFERMKNDLDELTEAVPAEEAADEETLNEFSEELAAFVEKYP